MVQTAASSYDPPSKAELELLWATKEKNHGQHLDRCGVYIHVALIEQISRKELNCDQYD